MAARAGAAPIWGTQALPGGSAAGGGGAGPRRLLSAAALRLGPPPCSPVPYPLHPLLPLPLTGSCFTSPRLGPQEPAAHGGDGGGSAGSSGCGIQYGGSESGRAARGPRRPPARPLAAGPRGPGGRAETIERAAGQSVAARRPDAPPRGCQRLAASPPPRARPPRGRALQPRGSGAARHWRPRRSAAGRKHPKRPHEAAGLAENAAHVFVVSLRIGAFPREAGVSCSSELRGLWPKG